MTFQGLFNKSFLFASHYSHTVLLLIPALSEFIFSPADKKHGVRCQAKALLNATSPAVDHYLVSNVPLRSAVLSILSILPLSLLPPLINLCIFLASEDFSGETEKERDEIRDGSDREMALVERRHCKFRFLKLL